MSSKSNDKLPKYVFRTAWGAFRFKRNVPTDIRGKFEGKRYFNKNLGKDFAAAMLAYSDALREFDDWVALHRGEKPTRETVLELVREEFGEEASQRLERGRVDDNLDAALQDLSARLEPVVAPEVAGMIHAGVVPPEVLTLGRCLSIYWEFRATGDAAKDKQPRALVERTTRYLRESLGDYALDEQSVAQITRGDANTARDYLLATMKPASVQRILGVACAALNFVIRERDADISNPFQGIVIKGSGATRDDRLPLTKAEISALNAVFDTPEDIAAIWATLRDTGARMSEVVYLAVGDVSLQHGSINIRPNAFRDKLKTRGSERTVPVSPTTLQLLQALRVGKGDDEPVFPRYARARGADGASQTMMKRLRQHITEPKKSTHSLRHSLKDEMRNAGVDEGLARAILGHSDGSVAGRYGSGYTVETMRGALQGIWK